MSDHVMTCGRCKVPIIAPCDCPGGRPAAGAYWNPPPDIPELGERELYVVEVREKGGEWKALRGCLSLDDATACAGVYSVYGETRVSVYGPKGDAAQPSPRP